MIDITFAHFYPTIMEKIVTISPEESVWVSEYRAEAECLKRLQREHPADRQLENVRRRHHQLWLSRLQSPQVFMAVNEKAFEILMYVRSILDQRHIRIVKPLVDGFVVEKIGDLQLENINREIVAKYPAVGSLVAEPHRVHSP